MSILDHGDGDEVFYSDEAKTQMFDKAIEDGIFEMTPEQVRAYWVKKLVGNSKVDFTFGETLPNVKAWRKIDANVGDTQ